MKLDVLRVDVNWVLFKNSCDDDLGVDMNWGFFRKSCDCEIEGIEAMVLMVNLEVNLGVIKKG